MWTRSALLAAGTLLALSPDVQAAPPGCTGLAGCPEVELGDGHANAGGSGSTGGGQGR